MRTRDELLDALAPSNVFQPATMLWRIFEIEAVLRYASSQLRGSGVDIGCGDGELGEVVFDAIDPRPTVIGIEPDPADAELAQAGRTYAAVHIADGARMPIATGSLDFAFSNSTLEHIPDLDPVLAETARVLRPDGRFVFTVPSEQFHSCLGGLWLMSRTARLRGTSYGERIDQRLAHFRYPSPEEWRVLIAGHGFEVTTVARYFPRDAVRAWERLSTVTGGIAFELFGGRRSTRRIQHALRLERRSPRLAAISSWVARRSAGRAFEAEIRDGEPSGGLLVVATRAP